VSQVEGAPAKRTRLISQSLALWRVLHSFSSDRYHHKTVSRAHASPLYWIVASSAISEFGDWLVFLYVATVLGGSANSAYLLAAFFTITSLVNIAAAPFAAAAIRRIGYANLLFWGRFVQAAFVLLILAAPAASKEGWLLFAFILIIFPLLKVIDLYTNIGFVALLPRLFTGEKLLRANAAVATADNALSVAAPVVAGFLLATLSLHGVIALDSLSFVLSALVLLPLLARLRAVNVVEPEDGSKRTARGLGQKIREVFAASSSPSYARYAVFIAVFFALGAGAINTLMPAYALSVGNKMTYGFLTSATGLGFLIASSVLAIGASKVAAERLVVLGLAVVAAANLIWAATSSAPLAIAVALINGMGNELYGLGFKTFLQTHTPAPRLVRLYSMLAVVEESVGTVAPMLAGVTAAALGVRAAYVMAFGFAVLAMLASLRLKNFAFANAKSS